MNEDVERRKSPYEHVHKCRVCKRTFRKCGPKFGGNLSRVQRDLIERQILLETRVRAGETIQTMEDLQTTKEWTKDFSHRFCTAMPGEIVDGVAQGICPNCEEQPARMRLPQL